MSGISHRSNLPKVLVENGMKDGKEPRPGDVYGSMQKNAMRGSVDGESPTLNAAMGMGGGQIPMVVMDETEGRQKAVEQAWGMIHSKRGGKPKGISLEPDGTIRPYITGGGINDTLSEDVVMNENNEAHTLLTAHKPKMYGQSTNYRIRKLSPTECLRLMDFEDESIDKILGAVSMTQGYKLAGNSICVGVLYHIFRKAFVEKGCEDGQPTLF